MTTAANVVETCDPVMQRVPLALRQEYEAKWYAYGATCRAFSTSSDKDRREAYRIARECEDRFAAALKQAQAEQNREKARGRRKATSGTP